MLIKLGKFIKSKKEWDSENIICPIKPYSRIRYLNIRMIIRVVLSLPFFFFLGMKLANIGTTLRAIINYGIRFSLYYIILFYVFQLIHEPTHLLFLSKPFSKRNTLLFFNKKRLITYSLENKYNPLILSLSLLTPFIFYTIIPIMVIIFWEYNLVLFTLALANLILSSDDILNFFILLIYCDFNEEQSLYALNNILTSDTTSPIDAPVAEDSTLVINNISTVDSILTTDIILDTDSILDPDTTIVPDNALTVDTTLVIDDTLTKDNTLIVDNTISTDNDLLLDKEQEKEDAN